MNSSKEYSSLDNSLLNNHFKLNYAPHLGMFENITGNSIEGQIKFIADAGFKAMEDNWYFDRPESEQDEIANALEKYGVRMATFLAISLKRLTSPSITTGDSKLADDFLEQIQHSISLAKKVNATWMTIVSGYASPEIYPEQQWVNAANAFKKAAKMLEPHGLILVLEGTNFIDRPGILIKSVPQAYAMCKAVNSPSFKLLFDMYHAQRQSGNIIPMIDEFWDEVAYMQAADNPGRLEPTSGELNYKNIFRHIYNKGYKGIIGMEHGNSKSGADGDQAVIRAYQECDSF